MADLPNPRHAVGRGGPGRLNGTLGWLLAMVLAVVTTVLFMQRDDTAWLSRALAQGRETGVGPGFGARGIYAFPGQLGPREYGVFMMDVDSGTLWCYQLVRGRTGESYLQLVAARSWLADRYLEEFNVGSPTPSEVQQLLRQQRALRTPATPLTAPAGEREAQIPPASQPVPLQVPEVP